MDGAVHHVDTHYLDLATVAQRLSVSTRTVRKWVRQPVDPLPAFRIGGKLLFDYAGEVLTWVGRRRVRTDLSDFVDGTASKILGGLNDVRNTENSTSA